MFSKKKMIASAVLAVLIIGAILIYFGAPGGERPVRFNEVKENQIPTDITADVIPEYKIFERALACRVGDDIYVLVTRGEKPSSGFDVSVDKMTVEETDGKKNLIVYALFEDPQKETAISQILTYPLCIVKTDLTTLPDTIELRIKY